MTIKFSGSVRYPCVALLGAFAALCMFASSASFASEVGGRVSPGDVARFMAGLEPSGNSPLLARADTRMWWRHAKNMDRAWGRLDERQLSSIAAWSQANLRGAQKTMLYMFSGPDFLYAKSFFPNAKTYVFAGLEPIGVAPDLMNLSDRRVADGLSHLRSSINTVLRVSFFITREMREKLTGKGFKGILPVLYVFLARAGKDVEKVSYVQLGADGSLMTVPTLAEATGVRIAYTSGPKSRRQVLYYFRTDLSNYLLRNIGFLKFLKTLGPADSFVKSASYLMHLRGFDGIRDHLLVQSRRLVQDDSGIPLRHFQNAEWAITPHGRYRGPIPLFSEHYQRDMARLFRRKNARRIRFGIGYRWRSNQSNLIIATKKR